MMCGMPYALRRMTALGPLWFLWPLAAAAGATHRSAAALAIRASESLRPPARIPANVTDPATRGAGCALLKRPPQRFDARDRPFEVVPRQLVVGDGIDESARRLISGRGRLREQQEVNSRPRAHHGALRGRPVVGRHRRLEVVGDRHA